MIENVYPVLLKWNIAVWASIEVVSDSLTLMDGNDHPLDVYRSPSAGTVLSGAAWSRTGSSGMAGISGAGVVCVLSFQAKTAGETRLSLIQAVAINSTQQQLLSKRSQVTIAVH